MPEKEKTPSQCDPEAIGHTLHTDACATVDLAFGLGQRYDLPASQAILEVFPERQLCRITTPTSRLELFSNPAPQVVSDQVVIKREAAQEEATLTVSPDGTVVFGYVHRPAPPAEATATPQRPPKPPDAALADDPPAVDLAPPTVTRPPAGPKPRPGPTGNLPDTPLSVAADAAPTSDRRTADKQTTEQQPRVQLTGRLGRDPSFRTSPRGTLVGRFPLAVHRQDGTTTWHSVLAFGHRAEQLQHRIESGKLAKGQEVSLVGYQHTRAQPTREGGTKTVTEIYAVAVTRR